MRSGFITGETLFPSPLCQQGEAGHIVKVLKNWHRLGCEFCWVTARPVICDFCFLIINSVLEKKVKVLASLNQLWLVWSGSGCSEPVLSGSSQSEPVSAGGLFRAYWACPGWSELALASLSPFGVVWVVSIQSALSSSHMYFNSADFTTPRWLSPALSDQFVPTEVGTGTDATIPGHTGNAWLWTQFCYFYNYTYVW